MTTPVEPDARRRAQRSKDHHDCRSATIRPSLDKIALALSSPRDNYHLAATAKMAILVVAAFPSRLSRYSSIEMSPRANLSKVFQDTALEAVLRALFSLPESGDREKLRHMVRDYIEGPGRPTLIDGFAQSENTFAFANAKRTRFLKYWRAAIDQIM